MPTEKQLTAMQQLIAYKDNLIKERGNELTAIDVLLMTMNKAEELLPTERQQLIDARVQLEINRFGNSTEKGILEAVERAEEYYNETFKTQ